MCDIIQAGSKAIVQNISQTKHLEKTKQQLRAILTTDHHYRKMKKTKLNYKQSMPTARTLCAWKKYLKTINIKVPTLLLQIDRKLDKI